ncbi:unnamed protein product, partial [Scytosiphon promiscuus]
ATCLTAEQQVSLRLRAIYMASQPVRRRTNAAPPAGAGSRSRTEIGEHDISRRIGSTTSTSAGGSPAARTAATRFGGDGRPTTPLAPPPARDGEGRPRASLPTLRFLHNPRVWALAGPCIAVLLLVGKRATALVAAFGLMACYCFDLADNVEGALVSLWTAVVGCAGTLAWAGSSLRLVHQLNVLAFVLLVGVWATLQFRPIYRTEPEVARLLERLLFACFPLPAAAILTWAAVALGGAEYAAPSFAVVMYGAVGLYAVPLRSGLGRGGAGGVHGDSSRTGPVLCACMLFLPALVQISIDRRLLVWAGGAARSQSLQKVLSAAALPWPLLLSLRPKGVLWWAEPGLRRRLDKVLSVGGVVALLVLCETVKSLVLLPVFRPFLFSAPRPPLDSLLASGVLACLLAACLVQGLGGRRGVYAARALTVASVRCLGLLLGVEQAVMPLFDLSALALSMLVFSGRRDLRAYVVGAAGVSSFILWFSWQTVWHLSFGFAIAPPGWQGADPPGSGQDQASLSAPTLSLQQASVCCALLSFFALLVPGMASFGVRQAGIGIVCGLHAVVLLLLEIVLVRAEANDPWQLGGLYPLPLAALTGALWAWVAFRLVRERGIDPLFLWQVTLVPASVGVAKILAVVLAVLVPTEAASIELSYLSTVIPIISLVMAATAPFALFRTSAPTAGDRAGFPGAVAG